MPKRPTALESTVDSDVPDDDLDVGDLTPLAIILTTMRRRFVKGDIEGAIALARIAAPYLHPRLPASTPPADLAAMSDADLDAFRPHD